MSDTEPNALDVLKAELDRTTVISEDFKKLIFGWSYKASEQAYLRGLRHGKSWCRDNTPATEPGQEDIDR